MFVFSLLEGLQVCRGAGVQGTGVPVCRGAGVPVCRGAGMQGCSLTSPPQPGPDAHHWLDGKWMRACLDAGSDA